MSPTPTGDPDITGFQEAQRRLRDKLGRVVKFYTPTPSSYPAGTALDPITGDPYDPTIDPTGSGYVVASAKVATVFAPLKTIRRDSTAGDAMGYRSIMNKDLIVDASDYPLCSGATMYELDDEFWTIVAVKADGVGAKQRYLVFGEDRGAEAPDLDQIQPQIGDDANSA